MKKILGACALLTAFAHLPAHAIVQQGHWTANSDAFHVYIGVDQEYTYSDDTGTVSTIQFSQTGQQPVARTMLGETMTLDGAVGLYVVHQGDLLTQDLLSSGTYASFAGDTGSAWQPLTVSGTQDFWLAARIRHGNAGTEPWTGLGWAHLRFDDTGKLTILGSAMAFDESSLVVGAVPEPSGWMLMGAGLGALGLAVRRQRPRAA